MWLLYQFPLCPFSRKVRLVLGEKGVPHELVREYPWERRDEFIDLNPAGETPVLVDKDAGTTLIGSQPICEYFDETVDKMPMIRQGMNALADAIPVVMQSLDQAQKAIERAAANMPDPTYPRR